MSETKVESASIKEIPPIIPPDRRNGAIFPALRFLGLLLYFASVLSYRSYQNRPVLGLWSYPFFSIVVISGVLTLVAALSLWRAVRNKVLPGRPAKLVDVAIFLWGFAYFLAGKLDPSETGRVRVLNLFASSLIVPSLIEWLALVFLFSAAAPFIFDVQGRWAKPRLALGSILVLALALEGGVRVKDAIAPVDQGVPSCASLQWTRRHVRLNSLGFRDADHALTAAPSTKRLLVVGDSIAFGWGIPDANNRLGEQVVQRLQRRTGETWEAMNASRGGADTLDEIGFLQKMMPYQPNVVLLIYVFNDLDYLAPQLSPHLASSPILPQWLLYSNSYLAQEIILRLRLVYYQFWPAPQLGPDPYMNRELVARHLQDVVRFVRIAAQNGATVKVVPFEIDPGTQFRVRYQRFLEQATEAQLPICSLQHTFERYNLRELTVSPLDGHPNEFADRLAADTIAQCLAH